MKKVIQTTRTDNNNYNKKKNPKEMKKKKQSLVFGPRVSIEGRKCAAEMVRNKL